MKKLDKKGFTLAELLIVVAIIAILVAIGIPAFSTAMERSRESVDMANTRAAYAEFMAGTLSGDAVVGAIQITVKQKQANWIIDTSGIDGSLDTTAKMSALDFSDSTKLDKGKTYLIFTQEPGTAKPKLAIAKDLTTGVDATKYEETSSTEDGQATMKFYKQK